MTIAMSMINVLIDLFMSLMTEFVVFFHRHFDYRDFTVNMIISIAVNVSFAVFFIEMVPFFLHFVAPACFLIALVTIATLFTNFVDCPGNLALVSSFRRWLERFDFVVFGDIDFDEFRFSVFVDFLHLVSGVFEVLRHIIQKHWDVFVLLLDQQEDSRKGNGY